MNSLGLVRVTRHVPSVLGGNDEEITFLDFTIDGRSLGDRFPCALDVTALTIYDHDFRKTNLKRLTGQRVPLPDFVQQYHRTRLQRLIGLRGTPVAHYESVFADGRVGLYYCACGDLDCGVLSTRIELDARTVTWHDIGYQATWEPFSLSDQSDVPAVTFVFERKPYERLLHGLLNADWSQGVPDPNLI